MLSLQITRSCSEVVIFGYVMNFERYFSRATLASSMPVAAFERSELSKRQTHQNTFFVFTQSVRLTNFFF
jgi:hypothetical protein